MNTTDADPAPFCFTSAQRESLSKAIRKNGPDAELFISDVETFLIESLTSLRGEVPKRASKRERMRRYANIKVSAETLRAALQETGTGDTGWRMTTWVAHTLKRRTPMPDFDALTGDENFAAHSAYHKPFAEEAEDLIARLDADLGVFIDGLELEARSISWIKRGRQSESATWGFFLSVGMAYKDRFGQLPSPHPKGCLHAFVIEALGYAGLCQSSWYKILKQAIDFLKEASAV